MRISFNFNSVIVQNDKYNKFNPVLYWKLGKLFDDVDINIKNITITDANLFEIEGHSKVIDQELKESKEMISTHGGWGHLRRNVV